jgi:Type VI secretion system effector, Hcp
VKSGIPVLIYVSKHEAIYHSLNRNCGLRIIRRSRSKILGLVNTLKRAATEIDKNTVELDGSVSGEIWGSNSTKGSTPANSAEAIGFNFSISSPSSGSAGTGAGAGKVVFVPFTISKHPDSGSPKVLQAALTGETIKSAKFTVQQPAGSK